MALLFVNTKVIGMTARLSALAAFWAVLVVGLNGGCLRLGPEADTLEDLGARRAYFSERLKEPIELGSSHTSVTGLMHAFFGHLSAGRVLEAEALLLTAEEYRDIYWPRQKERYNMQPGMTPARALEWAEGRKRMGMANLATFVGKSLRIKSIQYDPRSPVNMGALTGYVLDGITIELEGRQLLVETIRVVVEHQGRYKIATLRNE